MYISPTQYSRAFREIKRTSLSHSTCKLILFVSCLNIDALCSAKILSLLLKKELIQYQLIPVVGYSDLKKHFGELDDDITNVILIGCGAMLDLESFFEIDAETYVNGRVAGEHDDDLGHDPFSGKMSLKRRIYIFDGHRPWNLDNIFGSSVLVCFDDGSIETSLVQEKQAYKTLSEREDDEESSESDDASDDSVDGDEDHVIELREATDVDSDGDFGDNDEDNEENIEIGSDDDSYQISKKRRKQELRAKNFKKRRRKEMSALEDVVEAYYNQGTTIVTSTTAIIYALLSSIGETSIDNLWLSIIGTSSLDDHYPEVYDKIQPLFKDEVFRLNPSNNNGLIDRTADSTTLSIDKDYHLFLLRHWTLYDSFFYSSHVNSKLNLWTEQGRKRLHKLFAKMGVSLAIAQQKWLYMDISIKKQLPSIFNKYLPLYGLEGIVREGFIRTFGFTGQLSGIECVEALTALLECDRRALMSDGTQTEADSNDMDDEDYINSRIEKKEKTWVNNFWSSWDALSMDENKSGLSKISVNSIAKKEKGFDLLLQGLEHAKNLQQIIFRTGMSLLERKLVKNLRLYRLCVLNDGTIPELKIFNSPLILNKLGSWLLENITEIEFVNSPNNLSLKPLVVASLDVASDTYLVIGLAPKYPRGMDNSTKAKLLQLKGDGTVTARLNIFSVAFQQIASTSGAKVRIDSFDSSVIEIRKDDLSPFLEKLTLSGLV